MKKKEEIKEEVKEEKKINVSLDKNKQSNLKSISKFIYIISKITRILCYVAIPLIVLTMILIPVCFNNMKVEDGKVYIFNQNLNVRIKGIEEDEKFNLIINNDELEKAEIDTIEKVLENKNSYMIAIDVYLFEAIALLVVTILIMFKLEKLFRNIHDKETPFIMENVELVSKITTLVAISIIIPIVIDLFGATLIKNFDSESISFSNIMMLFVLSSISYILEYGVKLQKHVKGSIYN